MYVSETGNDGERRMTYLFPQKTNTQRNNGWEIDPDYLRMVVAALSGYAAANSEEINAEDIEAILLHAEIALNIWKANHE